MPSVVNITKKKKIIYCKVTSWGRSVVYLGYQSSYQMVTKQC